MTTQAFVLLVLGTVLAVYAAIALATWIRLRGTLVVTCPETQTPAAVTVDIGHAAATAVREKADLKVAACSRWPGRMGCEQLCLAQIAASPGGTRARTMARRFFEGKRCTICQRLIDPPGAATLQPGLMNPVSHKAVAWDDVPAQNLPDAFARRRPICSNCTLGESVRQRFPHGITDRAPRPGSPPPQ